MQENIVAILLMGGVGERFSSALPKQFHLIGGKPVCIHTIEAFLQMRIFKKIILSTHKSWIDKTISLISSLDDSHKIFVIEGGSTRQQSSYLALQACGRDTKYVIIHDAVRPFVSKKILQDNIAQVKIHGAVDTCIPSADTLVYSPEGDWIDHIPKRADFLRGQTPQSFAFEKIMQAHMVALAQGEDNNSDDCSLVRRLGHSVKIVAGSERNIKITTELDLFLAERLLQYPLEEISLTESTEQKKWEGQVFVVTGGTGGIGKSICRTLIDLGATVVEVSKTATTFKADLTSYHEVKEVFDKIHLQYGPIHGLINSIGSFEVKKLDQLSYEQIEKTIAANLTSVIYCCQCGQVAEKGHIINIASSSYSRGRKEYPIYSAAKAAVVNFTQALAEDKPHLCVNTIVPQRTNTPSRRANFPGEQEESLLDPQEISKKIAKLLQAAPISGAIIEVRKSY